MKDRSGGLKVDSNTAVLMGLARELFTPDEFDLLRRLSESQPLDRGALVEFDHSLGGPSMATSSGVYDADDRDVFRPLQYCSVYFLDVEHNAEWLARDIVEMSSVHIESLIKRIGKFGFLPLGTVLRKPLVKRRLDPTTWAQVERFTTIFNQAKHRFDHDKGTHLFSMADAVVAYFVCRRLGQKLYQLAGLSTDLAVFSEEAS